MTYAPVKLAAQRQEELAEKRLSLNSLNRKKSDGLSIGVKDEKVTGTAALRKETKKGKKSMSNIIKKVNIEKIKSVGKASKVHRSSKIVRNVVTGIPIRRSERLKLIV
jgi:parvulin-like peptidyl-prolyl isomerase